MAQLIRTRPSCQPRSGFSGRGSGSVNNARIRYQGPTVTLTAAQCRQLLDVERLIQEELARIQESFEPAETRHEGNGALQPLWDLFGAAHRCVIAADSSRDMGPPKASDGAHVVIESRRGR